MKKIKIGFIVSISIVLVGLVFSGVVSAKPPFDVKGFDGGNGKAEYVQDEIIVKYKGDEKPFRVIKVPQNKVKEKINEYRGKKEVEYAEPNYLAYALMVPNDPYYSYQWHMQNPVYGGIKMGAAWDVSTGTGVTVAVIDTGIAYEDYGSYKKAPDLAQTCFVGGYDFVNNDTHPNDDSGHGTHVAGTVAQSTNNNLGVTGVAFGSCLMPVKVLDKTGSGTYANVAAGIYFAADNGVKVINLSLGGSADSTTLKNAVAYAYNKGVTIVAAAGNDNSSTLSFPAAYDDYAIAVGATRYDETKAYYSNYGSSLDIVAPGGDLTVDQNNDGYGDGVLQQTFGKRVDQFGYYFYQGTSMASPHVAGTVALLLAKGNATTPDQIRTALQSTAEDKGTAGWDGTYGWGLVDAAAALAYLPGPVDNPPTVSITSPLNGATVSGIVEITATSTDDFGVVQVNFYVGATLIGTDTTTPYSVSWDSTGVIDGTYTLTATAIDTASQSSSNSISVLVDNVNNPPIANAGPDKTVSDTDGNGIESVTLDGSGSYDPDGTIVSYQWTEGATVLGTTTVITYNFAVGTHTVTLTVTDDRNATGSDNVIVTVNPNQPPVANAGPDQSAYVGQTVNFNGSGSTDDGAIVSYNWNFGDSTTGTGVTTTHAYTATGTYTVTLVITDNGGLTGSDTAVVTISEAPLGPKMHVGNITFTSSTRTGGSNATLYCRVIATTSILDASNVGVKEAMVYGSWSGVYVASVSKTTNGEGLVSFGTDWVAGCGTFTFTVNTVVKDAWTYNPAANVETSDSITLP